MRSFWILSLTLLLVGCVSPQTASEPSRSFESETAGFALDVPSGWVFASIKTLEDNRSRARLNDAELEKAIRTHASAPLMVVTKYPEPHPTLNPTIQVILRPLGDLKGSDPTQILALVTKPMESAFSNFEYIERPAPVTVSGLPAAQLRATYVAKNAEGQEFPVTARMSLIPRGSMVFLIGMTGPQDGPDFSEAEFQAAHESILITTD